MFQGLVGGFPSILCLHFPVNLRLWCSPGTENRKGAGNKEKTDCYPFQGGKKLEKAEVEKENMKCWEADVETLVQAVYFESERETVKEQENWNRRPVKQVTTVDIWSFI